MATYALRWLDVSRLDLLARRTAAEAALFSELAAECGMAGFPVAGQSPTAHREAETAKAHRG